MRILNLLVCLLIIARANAANTWTSMIFSGFGCNADGNPSTVPSSSFDGSKCETICGNYYKITKGSSDDIYTLTQYTDNQCATASSGSPNQITCNTGNQPATLATPVNSIPRAQCIQSSTQAPTSTWTRFALTAGPTGSSCPEAVNFGNLNTCQAGCGGSFKVNNLPAATSNMFTLVHYSDASCATLTSETDFTCSSTAGTPVDVGTTQYKIACNVAETPTTPTTSPTVTPTTGSASTVIFNITLLLAALLFALL